jgi:sugar phosphate permease
MNRAQGHDLMTTLNLDAKDVSLALALFYVAYIVFDLPSNLVMSRVSPRLWMARIVIATGVIGCCFTAAKSAWSVK